MGCDIHSIVQVRRNGQWVTVGRDVIDDPRNYSLFTILANVRNFYGDLYEPMGEANGLPKDFDFSLTDEDLGDHSFSHRTLAELEAYYKKHKDEVVERTRYREGVTPYFQDTQFVPLLEALQDIAQEHRIKSIEDVRYVFGFDS